MSTATGEEPSTNQFQTEAALREIMRRDRVVLRDRAAREELRVFADADELRGARNGTRKSLRNQAVPPAVNRRTPPP